jgi:hypothetical protein
MRKCIFLTLLLCITFLLLSCKADEAEEPETKYFTVTYHSEGHTSGEVPVDPNKYEARKGNEKNFEPPWIADQTITILGRGTLEKEGCWFGGWKREQGFVDKNDNETFEEVPYEFPYNPLLSGESLKGIPGNVKLHAIWFNL